MSGLACFVNADISRDLANDVLTLLTSTKPYLRKKAVLLLYKIFLKFPEALKPAFPRLKEKLEDPDPGELPQAPLVTLFDRRGRLQECNRQP